MGKLLDMYAQGGLVVHDLRLVLPTNPTNPWSERPFNGVLCAVVHHSAGNPKYTAQGIAAFHVSLGWPGMAYTFYLHPETGDVDFCHPLRYYGPQTGSKYFNQASYGVCCAGNYVSTEPPAVMIDSLVKLLRITNQFLVEEGAQQPYILPHKEISATACPGKVWDACLAKLKT
jgi:hypothetical protein